MATIAGQRAALAAAFTAAGIRVTKTTSVEPPCVVIYGNGSDLTRLGGTQYAYQYRVLVTVGYRDDTQAEADLDEMVLAVLAVINGLVGCRLDSLGPQGIGTVEGSQYLACDLNVSMPVVI